MGLVQEFRDFLYEYKILALAIAFIMGVALTGLTQSLVNDIIMPFISPLSPAGSEWRNATMSFGPVTIRWGGFLAAVLNFLIIAFIVFLIAKFVMKRDKIGKI